MFMRLILFVSVALALAVPTVGCGAPSVSEERLATAIQDFEARFRAEMQEATDARDAEYAEFTAELLREHFARTKTAVEAWLAEPAELPDVVEFKELYIIDDNDNVVLMLGVTVDGAPTIVLMPDDGYPVSRIFQDPITGQLIIGEGYEDGSWLHVCSWLGSYCVPREHHWVPVSRAEALLGE